MEYLADKKEIQEIDRLTIEEKGVPGLLLMECAAHSVFGVLEEKAGGLRAGGLFDMKILVAVYAGNNGGDGLALARRLWQSGALVTVWCIGGALRASDSFEYQMNIIKRLGVPCEVLEEGCDMHSMAEGDSYDIIVDGIFGVGLSREVKGIWRDVIDLLNGMDGFKTAIDVPSGVDASNGCILGTAFKADLTVTFGLNKRGMVLYPGCMMAGEVVVCDIGFGISEIQRVMPEAYTFDRKAGRSVLKELLPKRVDYSNKGTYGKVAVIAGSRYMSGAMTFAAQAAYRMGAGLVKIYTHENNRVAAGVNVPEAVLMTYGSTDEACTMEAEDCARDAVSWADVILVGPGLSKEEAACRLVYTILKTSDKPLVIDADALNIISEHIELLNEHKAEVVITPHIGEMRRLLCADGSEQGRADDIKKNILEVCKGFAKEYNVINVLKDARTCVSDGEGGIYINTSGNNGMSTAGSGDVLSGIVAGLIGTGLSPKKAAVLGVYIHGLAGDEAAANMGRYAMTARDIISAIPAVLKGAENEQL